MPIGFYQLLFRIENKEQTISSFGLDNILIKSCAYPSQKYPYDGSYLSFSCDFDNLAMCGLLTNLSYIPTTYNFTVVTGESISDLQLGPDRDHTSNSSTGGFIYWNRQLPYIPSDSGLIIPQRFFETNSRMCIKFAYYVNSTIHDRNGTILDLSEQGCSASNFWTKALDNSYGWQEVSLNVPNSACTENYIIRVYQVALVKVSVAFDDIQIGQCDMISPTTTTTTTTTSTSTSTFITTTSSTSITSASTTTKEISTTMTEITKTTGYSSTAFTSPRSNVQCLSAVPIHIGYSLVLFLARVCYLT